jgi:hypothetical protein
MVVAIVSICLAAAAAVVGLASWWLGWIGLAASVFAAGLMLSAYVRWIRPWHARWGATDQEVVRVMPGDDIVPDAASTTRAISVSCSPEEVWPWLVQIGYGRAGWYSYDWIDNDGKPSAHHMIPELQHPRVGDRIEMLPGFGPEFVELETNHYFVAGDGEGGSWCLAIYPDRAGSRLVSRWRQAWKTGGVAAKFFILLADPGAFIMEQKMLRGIKKRAESRHPSLNQQKSADPTDPQKEVA